MKNNLKDIILQLPDELTQSSNKQDKLQFCCKALLRTLSNDEISDNNLTTIAQQSNNTQKPNIVGPNLINEELEYTFNTK